MALRIYVDGYSGSKPTSDHASSCSTKKCTKSLAVLDQWYEPTAMYFNVRTTEKKTYILRYDQEVDQWTLQSGFDGDALLSRPGIALVPVEADVIRRAEKLIDGCEYCHADDADVPFDWILDKVTGRSGATTDYILTEPARCPTCKHQITEKTPSHASCGSFPFSAG
jgi:hypothetical protein